MKMLKPIPWLILAVLLILILYPIYQVLILSLLPNTEIVSYITEVENPANRFIPRYFIPRAFSLEQYRIAINDRFLRAYYVSVFYTITVTVLQFCIAFVMGFVFAKTRFKGRDIVFFLYLAAMVLPFHVTLVPLNQVLHSLNVLNTPWAIILPAVFSPLGVFLFRQFICQIPDEILEAATIDGAGLFRILKDIILPVIRNGVMVFLLLTITTQWAAIEPALAFIRTDDWRPVSLLLRELVSSNPSQTFAPGVLFMLPMIFVYVATARSKNWGMF